MLIVHGPVTKQIFTTFMSNLISFLGNTRAVFWIDNASIHNGAQTLIEGIIHQLILNAPYSPDLNAIEVIWAILKRRVRLLNPQDLCSLEAAIIEVWNQLTLTTINNLIQSLPKRVAYVAANGGLSCLGKF